tara:strand:+ start:3276 stop:4214 length:939 start_codon:yes stop_codon:yes gene_type:complete
MENLNLKNKSVLVTGGNGFLGTFVVEELKKLGVTNISYPSSKELDLRINENCRKAVENIDVVFHLAGKGGGIQFMRNNPADVFYDNLLMSTQLIHESKNAGIEKFIALGTVCSYPKFATIPFLEENLWDGYPEETNASYGLSKKMMLVQSQAYKQQFDFNSIVLFPTNLYGPLDDFDLENSHVIPGLISKIYLAKTSKSDSITLWGDGTPTRDFLYVKDAARGIVLAGERYDGSDPINLGSEDEISIKNLVGLVCDLMDYSGEVIWDKSKPNGQPRRCVSNKKAEENFGFKPEISLEEGLKKTIEWYISKNN